MTMQYFIVLYTVAYLTNILSVTGEPSCSPNVCNKRGECEMVSSSKTICKCYGQYYYGANCEYVTDECLLKEIKCVPLATQACISYYGSYFCSCSPYYFGRYCENRGDGKKHASFGAIYLTLEPTVDRDTKVFIVFKDRFNADFIEIFIERVHLSFSIDQFIKTDEELLRDRIVKVISSLGSQEYLPQQSYKMIVFRFLHYGIINLKFRSIFTYEKIPFIADQSFLVNVQKGSSECTPDIRLTTGAASTDPSWHPILVPKHLYKLRSSITGMCNESHEFIITYKHSLFNPYESEFDLEKYTRGTDNAKLFIIDNFVPKYRYGYVYIIYVEVAELDESGSHLGLGREIGYARYYPRIRPIVGVEGGQLFMFEASDAITLKCFVILMDDVHKKYTGDAIDGNFNLEYKWSLKPLTSIPEDTEEGSGLISGIMGIINSGIDKVKDQIGNFYNYGVNSVFNLYDYLPGVPSIGDVYNKLPGIPSLGDIYNLIPGVPSVGDIFNSIPGSGLISSVYGYMPGIPSLGGILSNIPGAGVVSSVYGYMGLPSLDNILDTLPGVSSVKYVYNAIPGWSNVSPQGILNFVDSLNIVPSFIMNTANFTLNLADKVKNFIFGIFNPEYRDKFLQSVLPESVYTIYHDGTEGVKNLIIQQVLAQTGLGGYTGYIMGPIGMVQGAFGYASSAAGYASSAAGYASSAADYAGSAAGYAGSTIGAGIDLVNPINYIPSFLGRKMSASHKKRVSKNKTLIPIKRMFTDWFWQSDILGTTSAIDVSLYGTKSYNIYLEVCAVDKNKGGEKTCRYTQVVAEVYKYGTWNRPTILINCMFNCGEGISNPLIAVDRAEWVYLKLSCVARCIPLDNFKWFILNAFVDLLSDSFADEFLPPGHKMISPAAISLLIRDVPVHVTDGGASKAKFLFRYYSPPILGSMFRNFTCPENLQTKVIATELDFSLCIQNVDPDSPQSFMFFQTVNEVDLEIGMLFAYGQNPFVDGALLAASATASTIIYTVRNDFHGAEYIGVYPVEIEVIYPESTSGYDFGLSIALYYGRVKNRPSVAFSIRQAEWCEVTQKMHFILIQMAQAPISGKYEEEKEMEGIKNEIMNSFLDDLYSQLTVQLVPEVLQVSTLLYELIFVNDPPLKPTLALKLAKILHTLSSQLSPIIKSDWQIREKPNRVLGVIKPIQACIAALLRPDLNQNTDLSKDPVHRYVQMVTKDEIHVERDEKFFEFYPQYNQISNVFDAGKQQDWENRTEILLETMRALTTAMCLSLDPKILPAKIYWPSVITHRKSGFAKDMYTFTKWGTKKYFQSPRHRVGVADFVYVTFPHFENTTDELCIKVSILNQIPYWWSAAAQHAKPFAVFIHALANFKDVEINATFYHLNILNSENYVRGVSHKSDDEPSFVTCHIAVIPYSEAPSIVVIAFKRPLSDKLRVTVSSKKRPVFKDFFKIGNIYEIGGRKQEYSIQYTIKPKKPYSLLYVATQPTGVLDLNYEIDFFIFSCSRLDKKDYDTKHCPNLTVIDRAIIACGCRVSTQRSVFIATYVPLRHKLDGYIQVAFMFVMPFSRIIMFTIIIFFLTMVILFGIAFRLDLAENMQKPTIFLVDNRPYETYRYVVIIVTGALRDSGTSSTIGIKIYGSLGNSKRHVLLGIGSSDHIAKRSVMWYTLTTRNSLGKIRAVEIWTDYRGNHPNWFCEKVIIRNYPKMVEWVFMVRKWFSLYYGDHKIHRMLYQTKLRDRSIMQKIFNLEDFYNYHIWFGMLTREFCHSLDRNFKVLSCTSIMFVAMLMAFLLFGVTAIDSGAIIDEGNFKADIIYSKAVLALILSIIFNYPCLWAYTNSNPVTQCPLTYNEFAGMDPKEPQDMYPLSYSTRIFCRAIFLIFIVTSAVVMLCFGGSFGIRKSQMWLATTIGIFILDFVVFETIHVVLRAFIYRIVLQKEDMHRFCNEIIDLTIHENVLRLNDEVRKMLIRKDMFSPVSRKFIPAFTLREKCYMKYRRVLVDTILYIVYILLIATLFYYLESYPSAYATHTMKKMIVEANYTQTVSLESISGIMSLYKYLHDTVLYTTQWENPVWMVMSNFQLLGVARLRQFRSIPSVEECPNPVQFNFIQPECLADFSLDDNFDTKDYKAFWKSQQSLSKPLLAFMYSLPEYRSSFTNLLFQVPDGGYVANLGRSSWNTRSIINVLKIYKWIDDHSRIIVVEFPAFNPHANLLTYVLIIIDHSTTGAWLYDYQIYSLQIHRNENAKLSVAIFSFLIIFIILIAAEHCHIILTRGVSYYCKNFWHLLDLLILVISIITTYLMSIFGSVLLEFDSVYEKSRRNRYIDAVPVLIVHYYLKLLYGLIVFLCSLRVCRIFQINASISRFCTAFQNSTGSLICMMIVYIILSAMLAIMFCLIFGHSILEFRSFYYSYLSMFFLPHKINNAFSNEAIQGGGFFGLFSFICLFLLISVYANSMVLTIIVAQYRRTEIEHRPVKFREFLMDRVMPRMGRDVIYELINEKREAQNK